MKMRNFLASKTLATTLLSICLGASHPVLANPYSVVKIGTGRAYSMSSHGQVVGSYIGADTNLHAFTYLTSFDDIGPLGGTHAESFGVNTAGTIVGYFASTAANTDARAYTYDGIAHDVGNIGAAPTALISINEDGIAVGFGTTSAGSKHAVVFANDTLTDIGTLGGASSSARAINATGTVVGWSNTSTGIVRAFLYNGTTMTNLGGISPSGPSQALSINDSGVGVGFADDNSGAHHAIMFKSGVLNDLGTIQGIGAYAEDINKSGVIVGWALTGDGSGRAYEYVGGKWVDLNSLLPAGSGWTLTTARSINDAGQITGEGIDPSGNAAVYLLTPTPFISHITPNTAVAGGGTATILVSGVGFASGCQAYWNSTALSTNLLSDTLLSVSIPSTLIKSISTGTPITVVNPGVTNDPIITTIVESTGVPTGTTTGTTTITPPTTTTTTTTVLDTVANTSTKTTIVIVTDTVHKTKTTTTTIIVSTLAWTSNSALFTVTAPEAPILQSLSQFTATTGSQGIALGLVGSKFIEGDIVLLNGSPLMTTWNSINSLTAYIPSTLLTSPRTVQIAVQYGSVTSNTLDFTITGRTVGAGIHSFPAGLQMIAVPFDYTGYTMDQVFDQSGVPIVGYDTLKAAYSGLGEFPADSLYSGRGYWVRFARPTSLTFQGKNTAGSSIAIPLNAGWNLIGDPFTTSVTIAAMQVLDPSGVSRSYKQAIAANVLGSPFYSYDPASNAYKTHTTDSLVPYFGYWILSYVDCSLVIAVTPGTTGSNPPTAPL